MNKFLKERNCQFCIEFRVKKLSSCFHNCIILSKKNISKDFLWINFWVQIYCFLSKECSAGVVKISFSVFKIHMGWNCRLKLSSFLTANRRIVLWWCQNCMHSLGAKENYQKFFSCTLSGRFCLLPKRHPKCRETILRISCSVWTWADKFLASVSRTAFHVDRGFFLENCENSNFSEFWAKLLGLVLSEVHSTRP